MTYDLLDEILYRIDYNLDLAGLNGDDIEKVKNLMESARHKLQMPPIYKME